MSQCERRTKNVLILNEHVRITHQSYHWAPLSGEDAALLALLEQRLARMDAHGLLSDTEAGLGNGTDIPLKVVGPQQRSGHVVDGSSQAILGEFAPGKLSRALKKSVRNNE